MRIQKFIAQSGYCSRRQAEELIKNGEVRLNGKVVEEMGTIIEPESDIVKVGSHIIKPVNSFVYLMLDKPAGYVCTKSDEYSRQTIMDLLPKKWQGLKPVGRLDKDTSGLILLTNDGNLANELIHPKYDHEKEYLVKVDRKLDNNFRQRLLAGIKLDEGIAKADKVRLINDRLFSIVLHQGWKRQIRRMVENLGYRALGLKRVRLNKFRIEQLNNKKFVLISKQDII